MHATREKGVQRAQTLDETPPEATESWTWDKGCKTHRHSWGLLMAIPRWLRSLYRTERHDNAHCNGSERTDAWKSNFRKTRLNVVMVHVAHAMGS